MADVSDKMSDAKDKTGTAMSDTDEGMQERLEQKMYDDDRERSANEE